MRKDPGIDRCGLLDLPIQGRVKFDSINADRGRVVECDQNMIRRTICRVGSRIASPCGVNAPVSPLTAKAVRWWQSAALPMPDALSLDATYSARPERWGHAYCTFAGNITVSAGVSVAASQSTV
jgi:hypothetical protein